MSGNGNGGGQHDARVQVLTAEVRTLMVGSRQVTMSVYGQLDEVPLLGMTPFGRVRIKETGYQTWEYVRVVGADRDGRLVASHLAYAEMHDIYKDPGGKFASRAEGARAWDELMELPLIVLAGLR